MTYEYKEGDNRPVIRYPATELNGDAVDVSDADEIRFTMQEESSDSPAVDADTQNTGYDEDTENPDGDGNMVNNILTWYPDDGDTSTPGRYLGEFEVVWNQGQSNEYSRHFPADASENIEILIDSTL